jgi:hypothetical protein
VPVEKGQLLDRRRGLRQVPEQPEFGQFAHGARLQVDAEAERVDPRRRLEHPGLDARRVQAQRRGQPADAGSYDDGSHGGPPPHQSLAGSWPVRL